MENRLYKVSQAVVTLPHIGRFSTKKYFEIDWGRSELVSLSKSRLVASL